jgi:SAM-dependent methyltransferase
LNSLIRLHKILSGIGINLIRFLNIRYLPWYIKNYLIFKKKNFYFRDSLNYNNYFFPVLGEHKELSGSVIGHYFSQDLLVASYIHKSKPIKHVDLGSRIDGFVAHVASFRKIEVLDIRSNKIQHKNIIYKKKDIMSIGSKLNNYCDSLSCLHTLEHFGLGRYGDKIDPQGHLKGFENLIRILKPNGKFYLSFPISNHNKVFFNSERTFNPKEILKWIEGKTYKLKIIKFDYIDDNERIYLNADINSSRLKSVNYGCGIYTLKKYF